MADWLWRIEGESAYFDGKIVMKNLHPSSLKMLLGKLSVFKQLSGLKL